MAAGRRSQNTAPSTPNTAPEAPTTATEGGSNTRPASAPPDNAAA
jgi:hypothetical protein